MQKLTKRLIESLVAKPADYFVWDRDVNGFAVGVLPSGNKTFQVQYRQGGRTRRKSLGRFGTVSLDLARSHAREILGRVAIGGNPVELISQERASPTVAGLCDRFLEEYATQRLKPQTVRDYELAMARTIKPELGSFRLVDVHRKDIVELHYRLRKTPYQANRILALLSKMFNQAEVWELRPDGSNPCRHVQKYPEKSRNRYLSRPELERLGGVLADCLADGSESPFFVAAFRLLILTGCRLGEIQTLRWAYVSENHLELPDSKTGARRIPLPLQAKTVLADLPRTHGHPFVIEGKLPDQHATDLQAPWRRIRSRAGLNDVRIHDLRHTYASNAVCSGIPLQMVGRILGHSVLQTTLRYAHLADEPVQQAAAENAALLGAALNIEHDPQPRLRVVEG
ncbi:site-specific integrase [Octadecabacter sp.]|nr:site-specific integrase [Octadecabacter sp.]